MTKKQKKCKHKTLISPAWIQDVAECTECGYMFGRNNDQEFFDLIDNEYYTGQMVYTRNKRTTDEDIKEVIEWCKDDN